MPSEGGNAKRIEIATLCHEHDDLLKEVRAGREEARLERKAQRELLERFDLALHGDKENGLIGLVQKVDCLVAYKPMLAFINGFHKWVLKVLAGIAIAAGVGYLAWQLKVFLHIGG